MRHTLRGPRPSIALLGAILIASAAIGTGIVVLRPSAAEVGDASGSPTASALEAPSALPSATASVTPATPTAPPDRTPGPTSKPTSDPEPGPIARWAPVGTFATAGFAEEVLDMTYAAGHFIAIGDRLPAAARGQVGPPQDVPLIWISVDGASWEPVDVGPEFINGHVVSIAALPDESAAIYGSIQTDHPAGVAWRSTDGRSWSRIELSQPSAARIGHVVDGPMGFLTVIQDLTTELWHSTDGMAWTSVRTLSTVDDPAYWSVTDLEAGPQGFVVAGYRSQVDDTTDEYEPFVLASADGREWFEAEGDATPTEHVLEIGAVGSDWVIASTAQNPNVGGWFSANGLMWEERGAFEVPIPAAEYETSATIAHLVSTGERVIATGTAVYCCHGPLWPSGVWSSFDGSTWERLGFEEHAAIIAAAEHDGVVVIAGFDSATADIQAETSAMFWLGVEN